MKILARACKDLHELFSTEARLHRGERKSEDSVDSAVSGARHKTKAAEKEAINLDTPKKLSPQSVTEATDKVKKQKKQPLVDQNGNELKRPLSAYMLFANFRRPILKQDHPEMQLADLTKVISAEWNEMQPVQQKVSL
jgi:hypothetical protein